MHVFDCVEGLAEELEHFRLWHGRVLILVCKEGAILCQLHNHVYLILLVQRVPQLNNVGMVDGGVYVDLALEDQQFILAYLIGYRYLGYIIDWYYFDGVALVGVDVEGELNWPERADAYLLNYGELVHPREQPLRRDAQPHRKYQY